MDNLSIWGHWAAIGSFILAVAATAYAITEYNLLRLRRIRKKQKLENYLERAFLSKEAGAQGMHTILHCICELGLTEEEITNIVFSSKKVKFFKSIDPESNKVTSLVVGDVRCTPKSRMPEAG